MANDQPMLLSHGLGEATSQETGDDQRTHAPDWADR
jgi:hypothetical protein